MLNCWLKVCAANSECLQRLCAESASLKASPSAEHRGFHGHKKNIFTRNLLNTPKEQSLFKEASIVLTVEDPYDLAIKNGKTKSDHSLLPNLIGRVFNRLDLFARIVSIKVLVCHKLILMYRKCLDKQSRGVNRVHDFDRKYFCEYQIRHVRY